MEYQAPAQQVWQLRHFGAQSTIEKSASIIRLLPEGQVSIGRGPKADYFLDSLIYIRLISRIHAVVTGERLPNGHIRFTITNRGLNGTYINDFKLGVTVNNCQVLHEGDKVAFGHINCGSIREGEYAPQVNSEFQFLFEKIEYSQDVPISRKEIAETNPFFSPFPSETPVYSNNDAIPPSMGEECYNPSSPRSTGNTSEKENKMLKEGYSVHSFDSGDILIDEKPLHVNASVKFNQQKVKAIENGEAGYKTNFSNSPKNCDFDTYSLEKCTSPKTVLPDVVPDEVKDYCSSSFCHRHIRKEFMRSHSLPAHILDDDLKSHPVPKSRNNRSMESSFISNGPEDANVVSSSSKEIVYSETSNVVVDIKSSQKSSSHMSKKKEYILSMSNHDEMKDRLDENNLDNEIEHGSYIEVKTVTSLPQWDDIDCSRGNLKCDDNSTTLKVEVKEEANVLLEKNKNNNGDKLHEKGSCNAVSQPLVNSKNDTDDCEQNNSRSKSPKDCKDKSRKPEKYLSPVISIEKLPGQRKGRDSLISNSGERKFKKGKEEVMLSSEEQIKQQSMPPHSYRSSPIVIMEKIPDNMEGKLWTHLKSKEKFSTKARITSPSNSKSSKKHHHHSHHLHHHQHVDRDIHIKKKSSTHLHNSIPSSHSSCSSKAFKSSRSSHKDINGHIKHKKNKSHHASQITKIPPANSEQGTSISKHSPKTEFEDYGFVFDKICDNISSSEKSVLSCSSSHVSKNTHSPRENKSSSQHQDSKVSASSQSLPIKNTTEEIDSIPFRNTRTLSTGFLSSDLNSDDEEGRAREKSPPNKKMEIVKRIYSPSRSPKQNEQNDGKHRSAKNNSKDKKSKTDKIQARGDIAQLEVIPDHKSTDGQKVAHSKKPDCLKDSQDGNTHNTNDLRSNSCNRKHENDRMPSKKRQDTRVQNKSENPKSSKVTPSLPSIAASISDCPTANDVRSSAATTKNIDTDKVNPSKLASEEKHRSKRPSPAPVKMSNIRDSEKNPFVTSSEKDTGHAKQQINKNSLASPSKTEKLKESRKAKSVESKEIELQPKTQSKSSADSTKGDKSSSKLLKDETRSYKLTAIDSSTLETSKTSKQAHTKNIKKQSQNGGVLSSSSSKFASSNDTKMSVAEKKTNLKRQRTTGDDPSTDPSSKRTKESWSLSSILHKKRHRLKSMSPSSSSDSSSSSSSSSSSITPASLLLFSEKFPPNKSKSSSSKNNATTKENISKSSKPSGDDKSSSKPSMDCKNSSKSLVDNKKFSKLSEDNKKSSKLSVDNKNSSKPSVDDQHSSKHKLSKSSSLSGKSNESPATTKSATRSQSIDDPAKQVKPNPGLKRSLTAEQRHQELFSSALEASASERQQKKKKMSKSASVKSCTTDESSTPGSSKKVLKKQEMVQEKDEHSKDKKKESGDYAVKTRRSNKVASGRAPSIGQIRSSRRPGSTPPKAGKKTVSSTKGKKKKSSWSSGSEDEDDANDEDSFDIAMLDDLDDDEEEDWNLEDGVEYCNEPCGAKKCTNPVGPKVNWVMCDSCEGWFHVVCVDTTLEKIAENGDQFECGYC